MLIEIRHAILLVGPPGSGKGTQGRALGTLPGCCFVSMGEVLRSAATGGEMDRSLRQGELVPAEQVVPLWERHMQDLVAGEFDANRDLLILDGLPRTVEQAERLAPRLTVRRVLHLTCSDEAVLKDRIRRRASGRGDDADESAIQRRFDLYHEHVPPLLAWYPPDQLCRIDAAAPPLEVLRQVTHALVRVPLPTPTRTGSMPS